MHSESLTDLSKAGLQIAIQDIKDELFDTPECDYAIAQLLSQWGQAEKAEQLLDEMLLKWGTSPEVLALTQPGHTEMKAEMKADMTSEITGSELLAENDEPMRKAPKAAPAQRQVVAA
ncbi:MULTISPECIES: hypothetical protein [Halomonadaceae]|uniref:Uncharacterized protein n=2 Tax=Vreelandella TaxID=3137766 RepID=A0A7Z0LUE7_9GAMM|nr:MULTISPECIES: hypothetical protein [Halomonas]NYS78799.1 hypothetical protein [Halomonas glaciei]|tara:strand:+ start:291 stop:644 length:354 start_codon:yes stop_codon:yes gene_type:complete